MYLLLCLITYTIDIQRFLMGLIAEGDQRKDEWAGLKMIRIKGVINDCRDG